MDLEFSALSHSGPKSSARHDKSSGEPQELSVAEAEDHLSGTDAVFVKTPVL